MATLALLQGAYFLLAGIWPIVHMRSFIAVTGPKIDLWLGKTVAVMIIAVGATLLSAGWNLRVTPEIALLAVASAAGLFAIDVVYVSKRVISPIYLLDAFAELGLMAAWGIIWVVSLE
jgi:hypothetical protein